MAPGLPLGEVGCPKFPSPRFELLSAWLFNGCLLIRTPMAGYRTTDQRKGKGIQGGGVVKALLLSRSKNKQFFYERFTLLLHSLLKKIRSFKNVTSLTPIFSPEFCLPFLCWPL
jgi:hypothetical protein